MWIFYGFYKIKSTSAFEPSISLTGPKEYFDLFNSRAKAEMTLYESIDAPGRMPFSEFIYQKKYSVIVHGIDSNTSRSLKKLVHSRLESTSSSSYVVYSSFKFPGLNLSFANDSVRPVDDIFFTIDGDSIKKVVENDSLIYYTLLMNNFSIRYGESDKKDIFGEKKLFEERPAVALIFTKVNFHLFLLIISKIDSYAPINIDFSSKLLGSGNASLDSESSSTLAFPTMS